MLADHSGAAVGLVPRPVRDAHTPFCRDHKERSSLIEWRQAPKDDVKESIDDIEGACFANELIDDVDVVELAAPHCRIRCANRGQIPSRKCPSC
jgi:hypothetical protein